MAVKFEKKITSQLKKEFNCYKSLTGIIGVPVVYDYFRYGDFYALVLDHLGQSLGALIRSKYVFEIPKGKEALT